MSSLDWPAEDYAIGSYIQATVADGYLPQLHLNPTDRVLDIGCGNGAYTRKILDRVPQGSVLGFDASKSMLHLAEAVAADYPNFSVQQGEVLDMAFDAQFDAVVSFWCLQWISDIAKAFTLIVQALKPGGKFFTLFPAGDDPFITSYYALRDSGRFSALRNFKPPMDYSRLSELDKRLQTISCQQMQVQRNQHSIVLPSLDIFEKFVNGIAFYQEQMSAEEVQTLNQAMVDHYAKECKEKYQGRLQFNFSIYWVSGVK